MKVSLNTIKQFTDVSLGVDELVDIINAQLGGVEAMQDLGLKYKDAKIVHVVSCDDHPGADRLHICKIDDGGTTEGIERDSKGYIQVVCGAPNVKRGMFAVWLPPKSTVPASYDDKEPFVLSSRELRGVVSHGMLASPKELGLGDSHEGLLDIDPKEWRPTQVEIKPGTLFAKAYGLDDIIIEIENKMFTHRPDCFGQLGIAREIAGIQHKDFTSPDWYKVLPQFNRGDTLELTVKNDALDLVPRFMAVAIKDVTVAPSPLWLQAELVRLGSKPINNIVDVTNYVMLLTGQPLHAYDYDKLAGHHLEARPAKQGETVELLNKKTYTLTSSDIVIVDRNGPIGLGGVMGGGESEVSNDTKNIVLECATFDMYTIRKTSMRHGLFTDAVTRFNKGQSPRQNNHVLSLAIMSINDVAHGTIGSELYDIRSDDRDTAPHVSVSPDFINARLGLQLKPAEIAALLTHVEFVVKTGETISVTPPFWRTDVEIPEDVVEEVGRLYGFDKLPKELPTRSILPVPHNQNQAMKKRIRDSLSRSGANEVLTYSFVHENIMKYAAQDASDAFQLGNALSPDLQYYRLSVLPSLLDKVHPNIKAGHDAFALFEIGKGHSKSLGNDADELPVEKEYVDIVYASKKPNDGAAYYQVASLVQGLAHSFGIDGLRFEPYNDKTSSVFAPFATDRSALIQTASGIEIGIAGELKPTVRQSFKLPAYTAAVSIDLEFLKQATTEAHTPYVPLSRYPKVTQDLSLRVPLTTPHASLIGVIDQYISDVSDRLKATITQETSAIYQAEGSDHKTITVHFEVTSSIKTLTDKEVTPLLDAIAAKVAGKLGAERV